MGFIILVKYIRPLKLEYILESGLEDLTGLFFFFLRQIPLMLRICEGFP